MSGWPGRGQPATRVVRSRCERTVRPRRHRIGPGGTACSRPGCEARQARRHRRTRETVGGVCVNTGTIPSKTLREAVLYLTGLSHRFAPAPSVPIVRPCGPSRGHSRRRSRGASCPSGRWASSRSHSLVRPALDRSRRVGFGRVRRRRNRSRRRGALRGEAARPRRARRGVGATRHRARGSCSCRARRGVPASPRCALPSSQLVVPDG